MHPQKPVKITAAFALVAISCAHADYNSSDTHNNNARAIVAPSTATSSQTSIPPSSRPQVNDGVDLFITADWLIWQANTSGLGYVVENKLSSTTNITKGHVRNPSLNYEFGFKVGLGCNLSHDGWDASLSK